MSSCTRYLYQYGEELTELVIPDDVKNIGDDAFSGCVNLTSVIIPDGVENIGGSAFKNCSGLTSISIPNSVTSIGLSSFENCVGLSAVNMSKSVVSINYDAFKGCKGLSSIIFPNNVTSIGWGAFNGCINMTDFYCYAEDAPSTYPDTFNEDNIKYATLHVPEVSIEQYKAHVVWGAFGRIVAVPQIQYIVDGEIYKTIVVMEGENIEVEKEPSKEGHTFSGWSEIPATMPSYDVKIKGTFVANIYTLTYKVDNESYEKTYRVEYGTPHIPEEPIKEGYTFSGWSYIPATMPARDVTVTGAFTINKHSLTYKVDDEIYKTYEVEYDTNITAEEEPTKEGYIFNGWSEIPTTMPDDDVIVTGSFTPKKYTLTYIVDGETYKTYEVECGATLTIEPEPTKEGCTFSGWSELPATMPARNFSVIGAFTSVDAIEDVIAIDDECQIFTPDGKPVEALQKGVNIIRYSDGQTKKVFVK